MDGIVWWEAETPDPEAMQRFLGGLLGWEFEPAFADSDLGADYWLVLSGGRGIGGLQRARAGVPPPAAGTRVYVAVHDLEDALSRAVDLGGAVERERTALGGDDRWFGIVRDPSGVAFGLWTDRPAR